MSRTSSKIVASVLNTHILFVRQRQLGYFHSRLRRAIVPPAGGLVPWSRALVGLLPAAATSSAIIPATSSGTGIVTVAPTSSSFTSRSIFTPAPSTASVVVFTNGCLAALDSMTHITAVGALDLGPVLRPRAFLREVACLLTVAAGDCIGITRLIALLGDVVFGAAVAAGAGRAGFNVRAVTREVSFDC